MRKIVLLFLAALLLSACSQPGETTILPTRAESAGISPRDMATATPVLPPTWTPEPQLDGEHLPEIIDIEESDTPVSDDTSRTYVVAVGDTLGEIAAEFGVTLQALADENNIRNWDVIEVGTVLVIPES